MKKTILMLCLVCLAWLPAAHTTNVGITNVQFADPDTPNELISIQFDIGWDASFRIKTGDGLMHDRWDAAWVFVKFRLSGNEEWEHAFLHIEGNEVPANAAFETGLLNPDEPFHPTTNPAMGAFIYRAEQGQGTFNAEEVKLRWNYGANDVDPLNDLVDIRLYAIEMLYVPPGPFALGSGGGETNAFHTGDNTARPYLVWSEDEIEVGSGDEQLNVSGSSVNIPAAYPKGYRGFYMMKHPISQGAYVMFLNSLTSAQASERHLSNTADRYNITKPDDVYVTDAPYVAMNWISWADGLAYLDWAALRPYTELEYEKAARGPLPAIQGEFAWGDADITPVTNVLQTDAGNESPQNPLANAHFGNQWTDGPIRVGAMARATGNRNTSGMGYWGIPDLSGNVWERTINAVHADARGFTGTHGNGLLNASNGTSTAGWPAHDAGGFRGGAWNQAQDRLRISDRDQATVSNSARNEHYGFRGVRTAPSIISGPVVVCQNDTPQYSATAEGATSYAWTLVDAGSGWSIPGATNAQTVTLSPGAPGQSAWLQLTAEFEIDGGPDTYTITDRLYVYTLPAPAEPQGLVLDDPAGSAATGGTLWYKVNPRPFEWYTWGGDNTVAEGQGGYRAKLTVAEGGGTVSVTASNKCGTGPAETTPLCYKPPAPEVLAATAIQCDEFTAVWESVPGATHYYVQVASTTFAVEEEIDWLAGYAPGYNNDGNNAWGDRVVHNAGTATQSVTVDQDGAPMTGHTYYYRVYAAFEATGCLAVSDEPSGAMEVPVELLPAPTLVASVVITGQTAATLEWESLPGATAYRVQVSTDLMFEDPGAFHAGYPEPENVGLNLTYTVSGLVDTETYFWRVQALDACGSWGAWSMGGFWDPRDGQFYRIVAIGGQIWMAENLNYDVSNSWCYGGDSSNCNIYGRLYTWNAAQSACPPGWHLPSDAEWTQLENWLGANGHSGTEGRALKSERTATGNPPVGIPTNEHPRWNYHETNFGTDDFGFSALPGGYRRTNGSFSTLGSLGYWWSATEIGSTNAWRRRLTSSSAGVSRYSNHKAYGFSVRCVRD